MSDAEVLFHAHREPVFRYLCRTVGTADAARDLTQEVFLRVTRSVPPDAGHDGQRAWVFRIARNLALNYLRDGRRRPAAVALVEHAAPATQELAAAIDGAVASLPDLERDVFLLRESAGLSYEEIGRACEISADAVRNRLHRARVQLRDALGTTFRIQRQRGVRLARRESDD
ncbi:MAG: RNA polymerase sigma factor [Vicinamibacterales bacterium]